jgi:hypothetical protein
MTPGYDVARLLQGTLTTLGFHNEQSLVLALYIAYCAITLTKDPDHQSRQLLINWLFVPFGGLD